jgi:hypothetical protein
VVDGEPLHPLLFVRFGRNGGWLDGGGQLFEHVFDHQGKLQPTDPTDR